MAISLAKSDTKKTWDADERSAQGPRLSSMLAARKIGTREISEWKNGKCTSSLVP